jgi:hypothetical protein
LKCARKAIGILGGEMWFYRESFEMRGANDLENWLKVMRGTYGWDRGNTDSDGGTIRRSVPGFAPRREHLGFRWHAGSYPRQDLDLMIVHSNAKGIYGEQVYVSAAGRWQELFFPIWPIAVCCGLLPALSTLRIARAWVKRRKTMRGLCAGCSYNLAGNISGVCPECGASVTWKAEIAG